MGVFRATFHMKRSFPNAELLEQGVQHVFDVDGSQKRLHRASP